MKYIAKFVVFGTLLCAASFVAGQSCPMIRTIGPSSDVRVGEVVTFTVSVTGGPDRITPYIYVWVVSAGKITEGQNTAMIKVDAKTIGSITATAEIFGIPKGCPNSTSSTVSVLPPEPLPPPAVSAEDFFNQGRSQMNAGKYADAIKSFSECIRQAPKVVACWALRGTSNKIAVNRDEAIADFTKTLELDPTKTGFFEDRGDVYFEKDMFKEAVADYSQLIKTGTTNSRLLLFRGLAYAKLKSWNLAVTDYSNCIALDAKNAVCYGNRGVANLGLEKRDAAIADFRKALEIEPDFWLARSQLEKLGIK